MVEEATAGAPPTPTVLPQAYSPSSSHRWLSDTPRYAEVPAGARFASILGNVYKGEGEGEGGCRIRGCGGRGRGRGGGQRLQAGANLVVEEGKKGKVIMVQLEPCFELG